MASNGRRLATFLLDSAGIGFFTGVVNWIFATTVSAAEAPIACCLLAAFYYLAFESVSGRTPGKWLTGTRVVNRRGRAPALGPIVVRTLSRFVPFDALSFVGRAPGWHDRWSDTRVVYVAKRRRASNDEEDDE